MPPPTISISLTPQAQRELRSIASRFDRKQLFAKLSMLFDKIGARIAGSIVQNSLSGQLLKRRTGNLAQSIVGFSEDVAGVPAIRVGVLRGPALAYAAAQELGATIRPKRAKALAIPTDEAKTPAGVDRYGGPRNYPGDLKFIPFRNSGVAIGGLFAAETLASGLSLRSGRLLYVLVREVRIEAKHFLRDGVNQQLPQVAEELARFLRDELSGT